MSNSSPHGLAWPPKKEDLERLYLSARLSAMKIAEIYGLQYKNPKVAESTVLYHLKRNGIRRRDAAEHVRKVTETMVDEWVGRYQAGESLKNIAGGALSPVTVFLYLRRREVQLRDKVEAQIQAVTKYERRPFLGDDVEKAYLAGLRYGDLHVVRHGRAIRVRVSTTHPAMASLFKSLFSPYGFVHEYPRVANLMGFEWTMECDLDPSFEFLLRKLTIPELASLRSEEFLAFISGVSDAEGSIYLHRKKSGRGSEFSISNKDHALLSIIKKHLEERGFHPSLEMKTQNSMRLGYRAEGEIEVLQLYRQEEVCGLLESLPLRHPEKVAKKSVVLSAGPGRGSVTMTVSKEWARLIDTQKDQRDEFVLAAKLQHFKSKNKG